MNLSLSKICIMATAAVLSFSGCGPQAPPLVECSGRVQFGGKPITAGSIYLHPAEGNSFVDDTPGCLLQLDGSFVIRTFPWGPGVPPGKYVATLDPRSAERVGKPEYATVTGSPWKLDVPETGLKEKLLTVE